MNFKSIASQSSLSTIDCSASLLLVYWPQIINNNNTTTTLEINSRKNKSSSPMPPVILHVCEGVESQISVLAEPTRFEKICKYSH